MSNFTKCPNCIKQLVEVPLRTEGDSMICPFCDSAYSKIPAKIDSNFS